MRSKKYVLDANIWISYFLTKDLAILLLAVSKKKITIFICVELIKEIERVLDYPQVSKYGINKKEAIRFVKDIGAFFTLTYPIKQYIPTDTNDDYIIALALQTNSGFVTSGDKDILNQKSVLEKKYPKLKIITKVEFEGKVKD